MNFTALIAAIALVVGALAGGSVAWKIQAGNISEIELKAINEQFLLQREILKGAEGYAEKLAAIQKRSTVRAVRLRSDLSSAVNAGTGLRIKTADSVRAAAQDPVVCSDTAAALGELLTTVSTERRELAEAADRHVIDIQELMERQAQ